MTSKKTPEDFFARFAPPNDAQLFSLGYACQFLNVNPNQLFTLMESADVRFAQVVDGVQYLGGAEMQLVVDTYNGIVEEINSVTASAESN